MPFTNRNNNNFDFLRIFAALCITFTHSFGLLKLTKDEPLMLLSKNNFDFSFIGLSIFFSISGYLIAKSVMDSTSFKNYIWKRLLRIQPLLIIVCALSIFIIGPLFSSLPIGGYFSNLNTYTYFRNIMPLFGIQFTLPNVFTNNIGEAGINGSMWTLIVEERLYLILGFLFLNKHWGSKLFIFFIAIFNIIFFLHTCIFNNTLINYLNGVQIFYTLIFLNASCLFLLKIDFSKFSNKWLTSFFLLVGFIIITNSIPSIQILLIPFIIILIANIKAITNNIGKYGDFTYGIYIFSFPVQQIIIASGYCKANPLVLFLLTLAFVLPPAFLSWHLIEKKVVMLKDKIK